MRDVRAIDEEIERQDLHLIEVAAAVHDLACGVALILAHRPPRMERHIEVARTELLRLSGELQIHARALDRLDRLRAETLAGLFD